MKMRFENLPSGNEAGGQALFKGRACQAEGQQHTGPFPVMTSTVRRPV